jgi:hypothetical protein
MSNYLKTVYNEKDRPYTHYPQKMCAYLFQAFSDGDRNEVS